MHDDPVSSKGRLNRCVRFVGRAKNLALESRTAAVDGRRIATHRSDGHPTWGRNTLLTPGAGKDRLKVVTVLQDTDIAISERIATVVVTADFVWSTVLGGDPNQKKPKKPKRQRREK